MTRTMSYQRARRQLAVRGQIALMLATNRGHGMMGVDTQSDLLMSMMVAAEAATVRNDVPIGSRLGRKMTMFGISSAIVQSPQNRALFETWCAAAVAWLEEDLADWQNEGFSA